MIVTDFTITPSPVECPWAPGATATVHFAVDKEINTTSLGMQATAVLADWWAARTSDSVLAQNVSTFPVTLSSYDIAPGTGVADISANATGNYRYVQFEFTVPLDTIFPGGCDDPSVTIELLDGRGNPLRAEATVEIGEEPELIAVNDTAVADFETPVSIDVLANDTVGGNPVTPGALAGPPTVTSPPAHGTVTWNGSTFEYTPDADFCGHDTFTYEIQT